MHECQIVCRAHALSMHTMHTPTRVACGGNCMIMSICDWICENQPSPHKNLNSFF